MRTPTRLAIFLSLLIAFDALGQAPPPPKWLLDVTRVAYTDLPNRQPLGDWPDKFIADAAAAKVQLLFSRVHSGEGWQGLAWKSDFGEPDPVMQDRDGTRQNMAVAFGANAPVARLPALMWEARSDWMDVKALGACAPRSSPSQGPPP